MGYDDLEVEGNSDYLKLVAGKIETFSILTKEPKKEIVHWKNQKKSVCLGKDCDLCGEGNKKKDRWLIEVWDRKDLSVKKLEFGSMIANQLKSIAEMMKESGKTIHDTDIRIKTTGSSLETEYSVLNVPFSGPIPQEIQDKYVPF